MEKEHKIEGSGLSESDSEIICKTNNSGRVLYKHASCQAISDLSCEVIVPIMFCTMFSPACEASLQVDLPVRPNISVSISSPIASSLNIKSEVPEEMTENEIVASCKKKKRQSKRKTTTELSVKSYGKDRSEETPEQTHSDSHKFGYASSPSPDEDCINKELENSDFSLDNDVAFWKEVDKYTKQKFKASSSDKFPLKYPSHINGSVKKSESSADSSLITQQMCEDQQAMTERGAMKSYESSSSAMKAEANDDWITDDEVDEEEQDSINMAFKREWRERRLRPHSKEKNFVCELCGKLYSKHCILRMHVVREHKEEGAKLFPYSCQYCKNVYVTEKRMLLHQIQDAGPCEVCGVILKCNGMVFSHKREHNFLCEVCNKGYPSRKSLNRHIKLLHKEKTVSCQLCDKMFSSIQTKNFHIHKAHSRESMPYKCDKCDFNALREVSIKIHKKKVHKAKHPQYTCKDCNSKFSCEASYNTHVENHISKKVIVCHLCSQRYTSEEEYEVHMKSIHWSSTNRNIEENTFSSPLSNSGFQYSCGICNVTLSNHEQLTQHMQQYHYMDIEAPRDIKIEIDAVETPEASKCSVQVVNNGGLTPLDCDTANKNEATTLKFSAGFDYSNGESALLMPASAVPQNVNMVDINGVQYHIIRGSK